MRRLAAFIRLSRFYFLPLPMLTYALGVAWAQLGNSTLHESRLALGLLIELLVQLSAAYINDYWDIPTDRINTNRTLLTGGSGELTTGVLAPRVALIAAGLCQAGALFIAVWSGVPLASAAILTTSLLLATSYTAPPLRLVWRGFGELTTASVAALLVPQWAYTLQTAQLSGRLLVITVPLLPMLAALFVTIALPDVAADRQVGKRTLPVQLGAARVRMLYAALLALGYVGCVIVWPEIIGWNATLLALTGMPLGIVGWRRQRCHAGLSRLATLLMVFVSGMPALVAVVALNWGLRAA